MGLVQDRRAVVMHGTAVRWREISAYRSGHGSMTRTQRGLAGMHEGRNSSGTEAR